MKKYIDIKKFKKVIMLSAIIGIGFLGINYTFCYPTKINAYIAANVIYGDVDGDGILKLSDIMKIANYTYKNKNSLTGVFELATDFDNNGNHNLQDIMKSAKALYGGSKK